MQPCDVGPRYANALPWHMLALPQHCTLGTSGRSRVWGDQTRQELHYATFDRLATPRRTFFGRIPFLAPSMIHSTRARSSSPGVLTARCREPLKYLLRLVFC